MDFNQIIFNLTKRLYPTGRAFKIFNGSWKEAFYRGLNKSENRAYNDSIGILNSILPDNDQFSEEDAANWERRLGIFGNENSSLEERKKAIERKIQHPGQAKARQHYLYIQGELQKAGFDVFIHENIFSGQTKNPIEVVGIQFSAIYSTLLQYGQTQYGRVDVNVIANSIYQEVDDLFVWDKIFTQNIERYSTSNQYGNFQYTEGDDSFVDSDFRNIFYICGETLGDYIDIPKEREIEFRSLILSLKPVQNVGVLLINYI